MRIPRKKSCHVEPFAADSYCHTLMMNFKIAPPNLYNKNWLQNDQDFRYLELILHILPIGSMYGIFTYMYHKNRLNVGKYTIHGWYGLRNLRNFWTLFFLAPPSFYS